MAKNKVVVLKAEKYNRDYLIGIIKPIIDEHFPLNTLLNTKKVLLKPNLLAPLNPNYAVTTHSVFIEAVGCIFKEKGFEVYIADNPSFFNTSVSVDRVYRETKVKELSKHYGFKLLYPTSSYVLEGIPFSSWSRNYAIINLPKLKTHNITTITCAVKNLYGCISGAYKSHLHKKYPKRGDFIRVLLKLYTTIKPFLNIVDAVVSLEGEGPSTAGTPRSTGFVVVGNDALSVDYVVSRIIGLSRKGNPLISMAEEEGYFKADELELIWRPQEFKIKDFKFPVGFSLNNIPPFIVKVLGPFVKIYPNVERKVCTGCGDCSKICPVGAIRIADKKAFIDDAKCISCMCCFEVCRFKAIKIKESFLLKLKNLL